MKKHAKRFTLCLSLVLAISILWALPAQAAMTELVVTKIQQTKSNWCWAAAAEMAGKYKYSTSTRTQSDVVAKIKGDSTINEPGSIYETANSTEYVTYDNYGVSTTLLFPWDFSKVKESIDNGYPVIPLVNDGTTGHYYVIRGYDPDTEEIAVNDPWDGERKVVTWSNFDSGNWSDSRPHKYTVYFDDYDN